MAVQKITPLRRSLLSIVVPTRNEAGNIAPLVQRICAVLPLPVEIIFVDDSSDNTPAVIEELRSERVCDITLIHRPENQRTGGLGGAVMEGLRYASGEWVCVMDADLQHPPEVIPSMLGRAQRTGDDVVIASRYCDTGDADTFSHLRSLISMTSTFLAKCAFPRRLFRVTDPMSGFFLVRRDKLVVDKLQPRGFKILLDILIRHPRLRVSEVGFHFGRRQYGQSKGTLREGLRYLAHLWCLRFNEETLRFGQFITVGASGLVVNVLLVAVLTGRLHVFYLVSAILATQGSTLWNFVLADAWVFRDRRQQGGAFGRFFAFALVNNAAFVLRGPMIYVLTAMFAVHYALSTFISLIALTVLRFALADKWIWGKKKHMQQQSVYSYDIHGIISVNSDVWLPELEQFMTDEVIEQPTMRVSVGKRRIKSVENGSGQRIHYKEGLGPLGFWIDVRLGDTIEVLASPLLRWSPHVLYTNVVEPILRWTFVKKGYALVHGACLSFGGDAYLVTARTDTGKTTTILRILDKQRRADDTGAFLSDDLTLVGPDGRVLTYPKPLTISKHTVAAIKTPLLSRRERMALVIQSRLHSREGRRFALLLSRSNLPMATVNAIVQLLVPPPKYHVQRLVPRVKAAREATLKGMFVIERSEENTSVRLDDAEALQILMQNCEDAYGFPPYSSIQSFLHQTEKHDLRELEHGIVADALASKPTTLIRSSRMDWSDRIARTVGATWSRSDRVAVEALSTAANLAAN